MPAPEALAAAALVHVVDDEAPIRESLALLLTSVGLRSRTWTSANAFLEGWQPAAGECLVADVRMPGMSGLELQEALRARGAPIPTILITGHGDVAMAVRAMKAGAADFIEKPFNDQLLLDAVHRALAQPGAPEAPGGVTRAEAETRFATLTPREREVMLLVAEGRPNKVVATRLGLSTRTVEVHRARVMDKMQVKSLAELVRLAILCGLPKA